MLLFIFILGACSPTCDQVCEKIYTCIDGDNTDELNCLSACRTQQSEAQEDENDASFDSLKQCLHSESCEDIEAGVCYDETLYSW